MDSRGKILDKDFLPILRSFFFPPLNKDYQGRIGELLLINSLR